MSTIARQVVEAIVTALNTGTPGGVPAAELERGTPVEDSVAGAIAVFPVHETVEEIGRPNTPIVRCRLQVAVEIWAKGTALLRPSQAADASIAWVISKLGGNTYSGIAHDTTQGDRSYAYEQTTEGPWVRVTQELVVSYQHLAANAEARI